LRLPSAERTMSVVPRREIDMLPEGLRAAHEEGPQREHEDLVEARGCVRGRAMSRIGAFDARRGVVPRRNGRRERIAFAAERDDLLMVGAIHGVETLKDVGRLPERQPEVAPLERNVFE